MEIALNDRDYSLSGMSIQQAMLECARSGKAGVPPKILWGDRVVQTSDCIDVPINGRFRLEFVSAKQNLRQGVDVKVSGGICLADGQKISPLRTWNDSRYESAVEYEFVAQDEKLWLWNVYEVVLPNGKTEATKWTDSAGFWIEEHGTNERTYHCSAGPCNPPDFEALVFKIKIL
jgi:hypothetical protein